MLKNSLVPLYDPQPSAGIPVFGCFEPGSGPPIGLTAAFSTSLLLGNQVNKGRGTTQKCSVTKGSAHDLVLPVRPVPLAQQRIPTPPLPTATRIKVVVPVPVTACLGAHLSQSGRRAYEHEQGSHKHQHNYTSQIIAPSSSALPCSQTAPMLIPVASMPYEHASCKVERDLVS